MFSARRLDYYGRSWIMQEYEFLKNPILTHKDGVGTMYGVVTSALLEDIFAAVLCTPVTNARDRLQAETVGAVEAANVRRNLRRRSHIPATGAMAFYMSGTAQTFDRTLRHAVSISTTRHRYLKEDAHSVLTDGMHLKQSKILTMSLSGEQRHGWEAVDRKFHMN
ncbi:hypothetical protein DFH29DRAFT_1069711 [Suillus ampliporus]|nr:hypothetical protein DFH29DRAFT_1069711 [Suillus ampliporus]